MIMFVVGMYHHNEGHMDAEFTEIRNVVVDGGDRFGVSCVAFDTEEELLWSGNSGVSSGVQLHTSPIARGYRKLIRAIRIFAFVARLAIRKD